jgi:hypothetical protein
MRSRSGADWSWTMNGGCETEKISKAAGWASVHIELGFALRGEKNVIGIRISCKEILLE